jgi:hypothetical protein
MFWHVLRRIRASLDQSKEAIVVECPAHVVIEVNFPSTFAYTCTSRSAPATASSVLWAIPYKSSSSVS